MPGPWFQVALRLRRTPCSHRATASLLSTGSQARLTSSRPPRPSPLSQRLASHKRCPCSDMRPACPRGRFPCVPRGVRGGEGVRRVPAPCCPARTGGWRLSEEHTENQPRWQGPGPATSPEPAPASSPPASLSPGSQLLVAGRPLHPGGHGCILAKRKREDPKPPHPGSRPPWPELTPVRPPHLRVSS